MRDQRPLTPKDNSIEEQLLEEALKEAANEKILDWAQDKSLFSSFWCVLEEEPEFYEENFRALMNQLAWRYELDEDKALCKAIHKLFYPLARRVVENERERF